MQRKTENRGTLPESFVRRFVNTSTPHEFFNRTWNSHNNAQFPQVYSPLKSIHRVQSDLHRDNEIPTLHIVGDQAAIDNMHHNISGDITIKSDLTYLSLHDAFKFQEVEVSLSGRSSRWMPKLSYNLKLKKKDDLYGYRRLKLRSLYLDPSYLREQVAYDFVKSMGLISSEFSFVRVFMNDQELGLFGMIDTFKGNWLSNVFGNGDSSYKNGYMYQGLYSTPESGQQNHTSDLSFYENSTAYEDGQYKVKEKASGGEKNNYKALVDFTKFIANAPTNSSDAVEKWNEQLDTDSFLRSLTLEVLAGYSDGYLTLSDNYQLYQDLKTKRFTFISSDMDTTLGLSLFKMQKMISGNYTDFPNWGTRPLVKQMMQVPEFKQTFDSLLQNTASQLVNPSVTQSRIDDLVAMIEEDVAWDKTLSRVGKDIYSNGQETVHDFEANPAPGLYPNAFSEVYKLQSKNLPLDIALNGPINSKFLIGLNEWIKSINQNIALFFNNR
ncbi:coth protein-domain-containing protein [Sporodiniella umbellata]|nr:coth protein-domain-containing protein [Sporodiniella umbellata]